MLGTMLYLCLRLGVRAGERKKGEGHPLKKAPASMLQHLLSILAGKLARDVEAKSKGLADIDVTYIDRSLSPSPSSLLMNHQRRCSGSRTSTCTLKLRA